MSSIGGWLSPRAPRNRTRRGTNIVAEVQSPKTRSRRCCETMIFVLSSFIRLSEPISRGTVTGQRNSRTRLRASCPTSRTSEHSSAGARGCDVRMFGCLPLDGPHREGGLLAGLRTYLPLRRTTLTQQLFGPRPKFRRPYPSGIANSARHRRSPKGRARWTCGCWRTGSWSITYFILCRSSRDCLKTLRRSRAKGCTPLDPQRFSGP